MASTNVRFKDTTTTSTNTRWRDGNNVNWKINDEDGDEVIAPVRSGAGIRRRRRGFP